MPYVFFGSRETLFFYAILDLINIRNVCDVKREKCRRLCADVKVFNNAGLLSVTRKSKIGTVNTFLPRTQAKSNMIETFLICNIAK